MNNIPLVASAAEHKHRFSVLDPLRFLAAVMVLFYHYSIYFAPVNAPAFLISISRFGYLGVVFFFMLSGFVITASAQQRNAFQFLIARAIRLYPAFIACLGITVLVAYVYKDTHFSFFSVVANATIFNDYLKIDSIDGVYWTLQAELKFYGCIFLLIVCRAFSFNKWWLSIWLLIAIAHVYTGQPFFMGWFINPDFSFYFIGGVAGFYIYQHRADWIYWIIFLLAMIFSMQMAAHQIKDFVRSPIESDSYMAAAIVGIFYIFYVLLARGFFNIKGGKTWMLLGAISYPVYLLHNRAGKAFIETLGDTPPSLITVAMVACLIVFLAVLVHLIVEKNIQKILKRLLA